ncbi:hypothetical protein [Spirosoma sp.]|uniref:hypothetical protein n=1 Tax=Spirosoma sp. TaxID=1899569 RepID=UPI002624FFF3|nr:hypothetical protein [Spirosoma sp.]MCX6216476.1 hypothetical protein [Spirosoma sp.]
MAELTDDQKLIASLTKQVETLTAEKVKAENDLAEAVKVVTELKGKLSEKQEAGSKLPTLKVGEDTYELVTEFLYQNQEVTHQVLKENPDLAAALVADGCGNLKKVAKKGK